MLIKTYSTSYAKHIWDKITPVRMWENRILFQDYSVLTNILNYLYTSRIFCNALKYSHCTFKVSYISHSYVLSGIGFFYLISSLPLSSYARKRVELCVFLYCWKMLLLCQDKCLGPVHSHGVNKKHIYKALDLMSSLTYEMWWDEKWWFEMRY